MTRSCLPKLVSLALTVVSAPLAPAPAAALYNCDIVSNDTVPALGAWWGARDTSASPRMRSTLSSIDNTVNLLAYGDEANISTSSHLKTTFKGVIHDGSGNDVGRQGAWVHDFAMTFADDYVVCDGPVSTYKRLSRKVDGDDIFAQGRAFTADHWKPCRMVGQTVECSYEVTSKFYTSGGTGITGSVRYTQIDNVRANPSPRTFTIILNRDSDHDGLKDVDEFRYKTNPFASDTDGDGVPDGKDFCEGFDDPSAAHDAKRGLLVSGIAQNEVFTVNGAAGQVRESFTAWFPRTSTSTVPSTLSVGGKTVSLQRPSSPALSNKRDHLSNPPAWTRPSVLDYARLEGTLDLTSFVTGAGMGGDGKWNGWDLCASSTTELKCNLSLSPTWPAGGGLIATSDSALVSGVMGAIGKDKCVGAYVAELPGGVSPIKTALRWASADSDGDRLSNVAEQAVGTNPLLVDSDGDGLSDGDEECACMPNDTACQAQRTGCRKTNALAKDSDGDSYADNCPPNTSGCVADTCHRYFQLALDGTTTHSIYPLAEGRRTPQDDCDMDDDGLNDPDELALYPSGSCLSCNNPDVDGDGIADGQDGSVQLPNVVLTMLYQPSQLTGANEAAQLAATRARAIADRVQAFFAGQPVAGQPPALRLIVNPKAVASTLSAQQYQDDCRAVAPGAPSSGIWLLADSPQASLPSGFVPRNVDAVTLVRGPAGYGLTNREVLYSHVARLCLSASLEHDAQGNVLSADFGAIRGQGSSEIVVRFPPRPQGAPAGQLAAYESALVAAIAHQLGHSLNLHHGGRTAYDCNPFYPSVMNHAYDFQPNVESCGVSVQFSAGTWAPFADDPARDLAHLSVPMSERGWPKVDNAASVDALGCWGFGDGLASDAIKSCTGDQSGGGPESDTCHYCAPDTSCYDVFEFESRAWEDSLYAYQVAHIRAAGSFVEPRISGCDASVLYPDEGNPARFDLPAGTILRDHDDVAWMNQSLALTLPYGRFRFEQAESCDVQSASCPASTLDAPVLEPTGPGNFPRWLARDAFAITQGN